MEGAHGMKLGQIKIQEMAFILVALFIFFALVSIIYLSIAGSRLTDSVENLREEEAQAIARKIASVPELSWSECNGCVDLDKAMALKQQIRNTSESNLWELDYLAFEQIYPILPEEECIQSIYPECNKITLIKNKEDYGVTSTAFVSLCHWKSTHVKCSLGRVYAAGRSLK